MVFIYLGAFAAKQKLPVTVHVQPSRPPAACGRSRPALGELEIILLRADGVGVADDRDIRKL